MASELLKTFQKIEKGRLKCIEKSTESGYPLPEDASLEQIAYCIDAQTHASEYHADYKAFITRDFSSLPDGVLRLPNDITKLGTYALYRVRCSGIIWPDNIKTIGDYAMESSSVGKDLDIPNTVTTIGSYALQAANTGYAINVPSSVTKMGTNSFYRSSTYNNVLNYDGRASSIPERCFGGGSGGAKAYVNFTEEAAEAVTSIGNYAFNYTELNRLPFNPDKLTSISATDTFSYCTVPELFTWPHQCKTIQGLSDAYLDGGLIIPEGPTSVGRYSLDGTKIRNDDLIFPSTITNVAERAFQGTIRQTTDKDTNSYFNKMEFLNTGNLSFGPGAFVNCKTNELIFHCATMSLQYNATNVFSHQYVGDIIFLNLMEPISSTNSIFNASYMSSTGSYLYLPDDIVAAAKTIAPWKTIASYIKPLSQWSKYNDYKDQLLPRE